MSNVVRTIVFSAAGLLILAACSSGPVRTVTAGDEMAVYDFSEPRTFEEGVYADATLRIDDGVYRMALNQGDNEVWWAQWGDTLDNVVIDVDVEQTSEPPQTAYGVACRLAGHVGQDMGVDPTLAAIASGEADAAESTEEAVMESTAEATQDATEEATSEATAEVTEEADAATPTTEADDEAEATEVPADEIDAANGDGYLFLIQGSGSFAILRSRGRSITPLVNWTQSDLIHQGPAQNELRAVCMDDYLALYINGELAGEATDDTYTSGQVGLAASAANRLGVQVEFDNLVVHEAVSG